jgi:hypothetical protein
MPNAFTTGSMPEGSSPGDAETIRIPYDAIPEEHADIRRKLATGWQLGEITGDEDSLFKYAALYPPRPAA